MALGGIYDQIGGGFSRYSVDAQWQIPHFEKMLYDNGPLLRLYSDAWTATRNPIFARVAEETAGWVMREMQSPEGGYYSSLDADSEHEEGKFYVWTPGEAQALVSPDEYAVLAPHYGLDGPPNFENAHWHLNVARPLAAVAELLGKSEDECARLLDSGRKKLFAAREKRVRPGRDEKVLVSWNALMIAGLARAAAVFGRDEWLASAKRALGFIRGTMWKNGRLFATYKDGQAHLNAYLDDYAYLLAALLELLQAEFDPGTLAFGEDLAEVLLEQFEDKENGGFFFTSHDHERLIHRPKPGYDNATPSGNGMAAFALQRLHFLTGESRYALAAERTLAQFHSAISEQPGGHATLLIALEEHQRPTRTLILRGPSAELGRWRSALAQRYLPHTIVIAAGTELRDLPPALAKPAGSQVNAWVCEGVTCLAPIDRLEDLLEQVSQQGEMQYHCAEFFYLPGEFMKPLVLSTAAVFTFASGPVLAADAQELLKEKACLSCHTVDKKLVGPAYKEVAAKYKSRKDAEAYLVKKIKEGSTGVWGPIPMPPNGTVGDDDAKTLAKYILTVK